MELKDKVILITGASRGIGKEVSRALSSEGAKVIITARNEVLLKELHDDITGKGCDCCMVTADLNKEDDIEKIFTEIKKRYKRLDVLINNAAMGLYGKLEDFPIEDLDRIFKVNVRALYLSCQKALKIMKPAKSGHIINISSVVGFKGYPNMSAYTASKHAVTGISKSLAAEAQEYGIDVSIISPGGVDTDFAAQARPDLDRNVLIPPSDIAKTVIYLLTLSDNSMVDEIYIRRSASKPF